MLHLPLDHDTHTCLMHIKFDAVLNRGPVLGKHYETAHSSVQRQVNINIFYRGVAQRYGYRSNVLSKRNSQLLSLTILSTTEGINTFIVVCNWLE